MINDTTYHVIVIGGGLAGLSLAIQLSRAQYRVLVLEKEDYPRHKVCGEYISMESLPFLQRLGLPISSMQLPIIRQLTLSDVQGRTLHAPLPQGGFGISRYKLDAALAQLATDAGATVLTHTRAGQVVYDDGIVTVTAGSSTYTAQVACGTWGKRSNMDIKAQRPFIQGKHRALSNYIGIKYHIRYPWPADTIALHNFQNGYCGISRVEDDTCCLCYLTTAANLQQCGNDIRRMEAEILMRNPHLKEIFSNATFLYRQPLAISQISFEKKEQVLDHMLLLGDAAGLITPLCGNGMSMAFHASLLAYQAIIPFLQQHTTRAQMEQQYARQWKRTFSFRLAAGRFLQSRFGKPSTTALFLKTLKALPFLQAPLIRTTAGTPF